LISENLSKGDNGIPFLKDVPVLGNLFKTTSKGRTRIELVVLLTPYIIDGTDTARAVRDAFVNELPSLPPIPMSTPLPQKH
jgi:general secretion pathway protein D